MLFETLIPQLPTDGVTMLVDVVAVVGGLMVIYSQFVEIEHRRDLIRLVGAFAVGVYALTVRNWIFILTAFGVALAASIEFIEIYLGIHKHTREDIRDYFKLRK
jgi:uncharacterized membrane protein